MSKLDSSERINSPQDLMKLREAARSHVDLRSGPKEAQAVVHMGTCGIAAGARDVVAALVAEIDARGVQTVSVRQSGCIGLCAQEPMLTFTDKAGHNFLYGNLTKAKVAQIVEQHFVRGTPVETYIVKDNPPAAARNNPPAAARSTT